MRGLKTSDIFKMSKILKKMGLKVDPKDKTQEQLGAEFMVLIAENLYLAENEVNEFLGSMVDKKAEEIADLPLEEMLGIIQQFKDQPGIKGFFKAAGLSTKQK